MRYTTYIYVPMYDTGLVHSAQSVGGLQEPLQYQRLGQERRESFAAVVEILEEIADIGVYGLEHDADAECRRVAVVLHRTHIR